MKMRTKFVALFFALAIAGFVASMIWIPRISVIPAAIAVWTGCVLFSRRKSVVRPVKRKHAGTVNISWSNVWKVLSVILMLLSAIATVFVAIYFGWWALLAGVIFLASLIWFLNLIGKFTLSWASVLALAMTLLLGLFGVWCIVGTIGTLNVDNLVVDNIDADELNVTEENVGTQNVTEQNVTNQNVTEQNVTNQNVTEQNVTNQNVTEQNVTKQNVTEQNVTKQNVTEQNVTKRTEKDQNVGTTTTKKEDKVDKDDKNDETGKTESTTHKHSYTTKVTAPTCTEKGYTTYTCKCGDTYKGNYKDALGHKYTTKVVAPTTSEKGYTIHTCSKCGHSYKDSYTDKLKPTVPPAIKCANTIRYGETLYVNLEGIKASDILVSNKKFVAVEVISNSRIAITLTEDIDGYITLTDSVSRVNVVIDIVEG